MRFAPDGRSLNWTNLGVKRTQDWTTHHVTFNSLDNTDVTLYLGVWGAAVTHQVSTQYVPCGGKPFAVGVHAWELSQQPFEMVNCLPRPDFRLFRAP